MASRRIIGNADILGNLKINGKYALRSLNGVPADSAGKITYQYYDKAEVNQIFDMLPVSRVGDQDYLPMSINGTFEGASSFSFIKLLQPCIIENDGTGVILRAGTNGSSYGFYYTYIKNVRDLETLTQDNVISTNTIYRPSVLPSTDYINEFYGSNAYELLFWSSTDTVSYYLTLTNETLNESAHKHCRIPKTLITDTPIYAHIVKDLVYMWCRDNNVYNTTNGLAFIIYTIPLSAFETGSVSTVNKVSGYSGNTLRNVSYTASNNIRIYDRLSSLGSSGDSFIEYTSDVVNVESIEYNRFNMQAYTNDDGSTIRVTLYPSHRFQTKLEMSGIYNFGISYDYSTSNKSMIQYGTAKAPVKVSKNPSNNGVIVDNPFEINVENFTGYPNSLGNCGSICQTKDGFVIATKSRWSSELSYGIQTYKVNGTPFDSWAANTRIALNRKFVAVNPTFGSPIGENLLGVRFVDKRKILLACAGTDNNNTYGFSSTVFAEIGENPTHVYNNLEKNKTLNGFAPTVNRHYLTSDYTYSAMISLVNSDGSVSAYGTSWIQGLAKPARGRFDPNTMQFDNVTYELSNVSLSGIGSDAISKAGVSGVTYHRTILFYVPDNTYSKSIAVTCALNETSSICYIIYSELTLEVDNSPTLVTINGFSVDTTRYQTIVNATYLSLDGLLARFSGLTVAKYNGFNYLGITSLYGIRTPGITRYYNMFAKVKSGIISSQRYWASSYIASSGVDIGTIPGIGFGYFQLDQSDNLTKSVFAVVGTTEAEMDSLISNSESIKEYLVVASQDVAQGFHVYFSQEVPVFLGGKFAKIPPTMIDLSTISTTPENSTFYIYAVMDRDTSTASYQISLHQLSETMTLTYIGKIVTNNNGIASIESEKVSRFLLYRPSTYNRGSAIPASSGVPSGTGTRWN